MASAMERLRAYREAGAQGVFAPGLRDRGLIAEAVRTVNAPLNILAVPESLSVQELKALGVKRISVGSGPMRACLGLTARIAKELFDCGTYQSLTEHQYTYTEANRLLARK
jgi:2-methylisocitrate lyase-like PEP mutase family enzyme